MSILRSILARLQALFAWWIVDIRRRPSLIGKATSLLIGIFVLCCACSFGLAAARSTGQAIGLVATNTPRPAATALAAVTPTTAQAIAIASSATTAPIATSAPIASATTISSSTPEPATALPPTAPPPTATLKPTALPTAPPKPTALPTVIVAPEPTQPPAPEPTQPPPPAPEPTVASQSVAPPPAVDVGAAPCQPGQIKGNRKSGIYHAPGQRDYAKTYANVECFDSEAAAQAAGYRRAKR